MQKRVTDSHCCSVVGLVRLIVLAGLMGLGLPLTVTIRVSRVSILVSVRVGIK